MFNIRTLLVSIMIAVPAFAAEPPMNEDQKALYSIGLSVSKSLSVFNMTPAELDLVIQGLKDGQTGKQPTVDPTLYSAKIQELAKSRRKALSEKLAPLNKAYVEKAASEKGAVKTNSGLVYIALAEGSGANPKETDTVSVNYRGRLIDGKEFDSSFKRGKATEFKLNGVIPCWKEGLQKMKAGGKARLVCPASIAYGENGAGELVMPGATLDFEVELLEIKK